MSKILDSTEKDGRITSVTFINERGAVSTLQFHPEGTELPGHTDDTPRVVGDQVPVFDFKDAREAVTAYENGEVE